MEYQEYSTHYSQVIHFPFITSSVEETLEEAEDENGIPKTRAQKRKQNGMQMVSSSNTLQPRQELAVSSDTSKEMLSSKKKKVVKNSTETPVKQGKMNMKLCFCVLMFLRQSCSKIWL